MINPFDAAKAAKKMAKMAGVDMDKVLKDPASVAKLDPLKMMEGIQKNPQAMIAQAMGVKSSYIPLAIDPAQPPRPTWNTVLSSTRIQPDGKFNRNSFNFVFFPRTNEAGETVNLSSHTEERLHLQVFQDGKMVFDHYYQGDSEGNVGTSFHLNTSGTRNVNPQFHSHAAMLEAGHYRFLWLIDDTPIYDYEFDLVAEKSADPYAQNSTVLVPQGLYEKYVGFGMSSSLPSDAPIAQKANSLQLHFAFRNFDLERETLEKRFFGVLYHEGETFAFMEPFVSAGHEWRTFNAGFNLYKDGFPSGPRLMFNDMRDGKYRLEAFEVVQIDYPTGSPDLKRPKAAKKAEYEFEWKNGRFVLPSHADPSKTNAMDIVEGGGNTVWVEPIKGEHPWVLRDTFSEQDELTEEGRINPKGKSKAQLEAERDARLAAEKKAREDAIVAQKAERDAKLARDAEQNRKEVEEAAAKAQAEAEAEAQRQIREAQEETRRMMEEMQKKFGL